MTVHPKLPADIPMTRLALVSGEGASDEEVTIALKEATKIKIKTLAPNALKGALSDDDSEMLILNVRQMGEDEVGILNAIRGESAELPVIVVSPQLEPDEMRRLLKFGIHDWLPKPINVNDLIDSIAKGARNRRTSTNRVHAVMSVVGGAGASTIALAMADIIATKIQSRRAKNVALFDLDFSLGNCGAYAGLQNEFNLTSVASNPRRVDAEFIRAIQKRHENGFFVYSFKRPEMNGELNAYELVLRMLDAVSYEHQQTILDIPHYMTEWRDDVLGAVNTCTLITDLNLSAIRHTVDMIEHIRGLRGKNFPLRVVFNKYESSLFGQRVGRKQIKDLFDDVPFFYFPKDAATVGEALDRGLLLSEVRSRSKLGKAVTKYLKSIELVEVPA